MSENLFLQNDKLKTELNELKEELEKWKLKAQELEEQQLEKHQSLKVYSKEYFQNVSKHMLKHCEICNKSVKRGSYANHLKSSEHTKKLNNFPHFKKIDEDLDLYYIDNEHLENDEK